MKFDAHVSNVGLILHLVAQVIPEPQIAKSELCPTFFILKTLANPQTEFIHEKIITRALLHILVFRYFGARHHHEEKCR